MKESKIIAYAFKNDSGELAIASVCDGLSDYMLSTEWKSIGCAELKECDYNWLKNYIEERKVIQCDT